MPLVLVLHRVVTNLFAGTQCAYRIQIRQHKQGDATQSRRYYEDMSLAIPRSALLPFVEDFFSTSLWTEGLS